MKTYQNKYQEKLVDMNILMLKVAQLEKSSSKKDDNLYDLEKYGIQMEAVSKKSFPVCCSLSNMTEWLLGHARTASRD